MTTKRTHSEVTAGRPRHIHVAGRIVGLLLSRWAPKRIVLKPVVATVLTAMLSFGSAVRAQDASSEAVASSIDTLLKSVRGPGTGETHATRPHESRARVLKTRSGHLRTLEAPPSEHFSVSSAVPGDARATARNFLAEHKAAFGIADRRFDLIAKKTRKGQRRSHVRFAQTYEGIPVFAAETVVQLDEASGVEFVSSDIMTEADSPGVDELVDLPLISESQSEQIAVDMMSRENPGLEFQADPVALMIYQPSIVGNTGPTRLVWRTEVASVPEPLAIAVVLVDAYTGDIALSYPLVVNALYRKIYDMQCSDNVEFGRLVRSEGQSPCGIRDADLAYTYIGDTHRFYSSMHGRDSIDDAGMTVKAYVRYSESGECPYFEAYWSHQGYMVFGSYCVVQDVVAHEYTHGVTQHESHLIYLNESGAINESFSDMWGEWVDQKYTSERDDDSAAVKWLIGEDLTRAWSWSDGRRAMRNMKNPAQEPYRDPDRKGSPNWRIGESDPNRNNDYGGVHHNCGVNNKLCYLLTDGDYFNGHWVRGMGIPKVAKLYYEVQTNLLTQAADYCDLYFALKRAANNLGWSLSDRQNLEAACRAVEIAVSTYQASASDVPKQIYDKQTTRSTLTIWDWGTIADLNVKLNIEHTYDADLDVYLVGPDGTRVELFTDVGSSGDNFTNTTLDDEASRSITAGSAPFAGTYRPEGNLSDFNGRSIRGTWKLEVRDDASSDTGRLRSWSLSIATSATNQGIAAEGGVDGAEVTYGLLAQEDETTDAFDVTDHDGSDAKPVTASRPDTVSVDQVDQVGSPADSPVAKGARDHQGESGWVSAERPRNIAGNLTSCERYEDPIVISALPYEPAEAPTAPDVGEPGKTDAVCPSDVTEDDEETAPAIAACSWAFPRRISRGEGRPSHVLVLVRLAGVRESQIDEARPLRLYPEGIAAVAQSVTHYVSQESSGASIWALFDTERLLATMLENGRTALRVTGELRTGQRFETVSGVHIVE